MLSAVPTNIITGFLGAGKSTAILSLLKQKPKEERWAVLVNEFGEVGIDGSLIGGQESEHAGVFIREVPGGCMCCAAGLPMQIALNQLLAKAKPDRLLIEPTGLGHPKEVLSVLTAEYYHSVIDLRSTITLVDARKTLDTRYAKHETFIQQLDIADVIVANKIDQYGPNDFPALLNFLDDIRVINNTPVYQVAYGNLQRQWLRGKSQFCANKQARSHNHIINESFPEASSPLDGRSYMCIDNSGEGYHSRGWVFTPKWVFDVSQLNTLLLGYQIERLKGVFITNQGVFAFNKADGVLTQTELDDCLESRIE